MILLFTIFLVSAYVLDKTPFSPLFTMRITCLILIYAVFIVPVTSGTLNTPIYNGILSVTYFSSTIDIITLIAGATSLVLYSRLSL